MQVSTKRNAAKLFLDIPLVYGLMANLEQHGRIWAFLAGFSVRIARMFSAGFFPMAAQSAVGLIIMFPAKLLSKMRLANAEVISRIGLTQLQFKKGTLLSATKNVRQQKPQ